MNLVQILADWSDDKRLFLVEPNSTIQQLLAILEREYNSEVGCMKFYCHDKCALLVDDEDLQMLLAHPKPIVYISSKRVESVLLDHSCLIPFAQLSLNPDPEPKKGRFGVVKIALWLRIPVACKILKQRLGDCVLRHINKIRHPKIVLFLGTTVIPDTQERIVVSGGSLRSLLGKYEKGLLENEELLTSVASDVALGINYLHSLGFYHGGLNCYNVLLDKGNGAKISDFGWHKFLKVTDLLRPEFASALPFFAPEAVVSPTELTDKADIYSFGIVLWHMFSGFTLDYESKPTKELHEQLTSGKLELPILPDLPAHWLVLLQKVTNTDPEKRPNIAKLCDLLRRTKFEIEVQKYNAAKERTAVRMTTCVVVPTRDPKTPPTDDSPDGTDYDSII